VHLLWIIFHQRHNAIVMSSIQRPRKRYPSLGGVVCYSLKGTLIYIKRYYVELNNARTNDGCTNNVEMTNQLNRSPNPIIDYSKILNCAHLIFGTSYFYIHSMGIHSHFTSAVLKESYLKLHLYNQKFTNPMDIHWHGTTV